jgi:hypothetical protein
MTSGAARTLRVHPLNPAAPLPRPALPRRAWMDATRQRFAYRCLPLVVANSIGWDLVSAVSFDAVWLGGEHESSVQVRLLGDPSSEERRLMPEGHFGHGILTLQTGLLLTTPEPFGLFVGAPVNMPRTAVAPLSGFVETNWLPYPFTLNWQFVRRGVPVRVLRGEPVATVWPMDPATLEGFTLEVAPLAADAPLAQRSRAWQSARDQHLAEAALRVEAGGEHGWQRDYLRGIEPGGSMLADRSHRTRLTLHGDASQVAAAPTVLAPVLPDPLRGGWRWRPGVEVCAFEPDGAVVLRTGDAGAVVRLSPALYEIAQACLDGSIAAMEAQAGADAAGLHACLDRFAALALIEQPAD